MQLIAIMSTCQLRIGRSKLSGQGGIRLKEPQTTKGYRASDQQHLITKTTCCREAGLRVTPQRTTNDSVVLSETDDHPMSKTCRKRRVGWTTPVCRHGLFRPCQCLRMQGWCANFVLAGRPPHGYEMNAPNRPTTIWSTWTDGPNCG